ncbi:hypothetical protein M758_12G186600, partial [Ceratodon purpureus]
ESHSYNKLQDAKGSDYPTESVCLPVCRIYSVETCVDTDTSPCEGNCLDQLLLRPSWHGDPCSHFLVNYWRWYYKDDALKLLGRLLTIFDVGHAAAHNLLLPAEDSYMQVSANSHLLQSASRAVAPCVPFFAA